MTGDDRFSPLPLVATTDSIDLRSRTRPDTLQRIVAGFAEQFGDAVFLSASACRHRSEVCAKLRAPNLQAA